MALVNLKDVKVYATFSKGFRVVEESKGRDGKEYSTRWTVWLDTANVAEGDVVSVSGFLSAKVNDWTDKEGNTRHSVELALNSPRIGDGAATSAPSAGQDAAAQGWVVPMKLPSSQPRPCCAKCRRGIKGYGELPCGYDNNCPNNCHEPKEQTK